ncbi:MAG: DUF692 domain-containing protein [Gammaproteobacteria bacterium]|nr:DUF692 domain-containing protein [Gammaproteobacteria bacterium]
MRDMKKRPDEYPVHGCGMGLRRDLFNAYDDNAAAMAKQISFLECAPENWIGVGGRWSKRFKALAEQYPLVCHGLSLSIGGPAPLDHEYLAQLKTFLDEIDAKSYSDHLSYCGDFGQLYDLMPIPFTDEAVHYVAARIKTVQDALERQIAVENVSYYAAPGAEMSEVAFINQVVDEADCKFLLDVNNIYVNSINHGYDPVEFLHAMPAERADYVHIAGHKVEAEDLRVDTHAAPVIAPVFDLLKEAFRTFGVMPTLLERDFNFPPFGELLSETARIRSIQKQAGG